ncbi:hypothetical protein LIER_29694 [Lithospermum erythrorhizon]|uniref:Uncharacterized protein n=1 Tax=Lithospermum erythrorhizon TaxID=34254 RepID=A0AAV3RL79_LITER
MARTKRTLRRLSHPPKRASSTLRALGDGHSLLSRQTHDLRKELARESLRMGSFQQELQDLWGQVGNYPWDMALNDQELRRAHAKRDVANQAAFAARQEREGLRHAYFQDSLRRCHRIGAAILSDFVLNCQDRVPTFPALAEECRQRYLMGWLDNTVPLPSLD